MVQPRLHVVTDDEILARTDFIEVATEVVEVAGGAVALHLRGPRTDGRRLHELAVALRASSSAAGALLVVNDRIDVAMANGLEAVHLGRRSLSVSEARRLMPSVRIGASCHSLAEVMEAACAYAAWVMIGNVFETSSHPGRSSLGLAGFREAAVVAAMVPVVAIGGVQPSQVTDVLSAGAYGVGVRSGIWNAGSPRAAASEYISVLEAAVEGI
ncbi:MAG: thiamine phosphate synthase [Longimicrobiales bacterium]|nr:thiamine phosphate synthase [Longimicrobiales bacterium]